MKLDRNQEKAVKHVGGPAIVIAGPGSGKTTVVTARILNLIQKHNVPPSHLLAIAFNRKAVEEMEARIGRALTAANPQTSEKPVIRTLHAFGKDILMENYGAAGFNAPPTIWSGQVDRIIAEERRRIEQAAAAVPVAIYKVQHKTDGRCYVGQTTNPDRRRKEHLEHSSNDRLRQAIRAEGAAQFSFEVLERVPGRKANQREAYWIRYYANRAAVFNRADPLRVQYGNQLLLEMFCQHFDIPYTEHLDRDPDFEMLRDRFNGIKELLMREKRRVVTGVFDPTTLRDPVVRAFAVRYEKRKGEANAVDFEDMIIRAAHVLETTPSLRETYRERYPYLLVDEFQDIAPADFRLISCLSENLFAVGDDDQAIYSFRGGDSEIMQDFAGRADVAKYEITRNYRSTSTIVEHARALIGENRYRIRKNLRAYNPAQRPIKIVEATSDTLAAALHHELESSRETAILARTNYEIEGLQTLLGNRRDLPEITTIHKAKGREWERVLLVHNTLGRVFPQRGNDILEERRVFYVAMTRAKTELVVLGGRCSFVPEFKEIPKNIGYYLRQLAYWYARQKSKK